MIKYTKEFVDIYPDGWANLPQERTPITAEALQQYTNAIKNIETYLNRYGIPNYAADLIFDATHQNVTATEKANWNAKANKGDIPTKLSQLDNDITLKAYLKDLSDVVITGELEDGQVLIYNIETRTWKNGYVSGGGGASTAKQVSYDNSKSHLTATNLQDALDEIVTGALNGKS